MPMTTTLPEVDPIQCLTNLTFAEWQRVISQLMSRDRELEVAILTLTNALDLSQLGATLQATRQILGSALVDNVILNGTLPTDFDSFFVFQNEMKDRVQELENSITFVDSEGTPRTIRSLTLNNQVSIQNINQTLDEFDAELQVFRDVAGDIEAIKSFVDTVDARVNDIEALLADLALEIRNARKEFADDPSKRLIDKIDSMDGEVASIRSRINGLVKEVTDARSPDRFDSLAEHLGDIEGSVEELSERLDFLGGQGQVSGLKIGRSILHGQVELIPGANIALTRERNGIRIDVVDMGTCVDYGAPKIDPNFGCCGPANPNFGN